VIYVTRVADVVQSSTAANAFIFTVYIRGGSFLNSELLSLYNTISINWNVKRNVAIWFIQTTKHEFT